MNIREFVEKYCSRCINHKNKNKNDYCSISKDINGKWKCANFEERKLENEVKKK